MSSVKLLEQARQILYRKHYAYRTEQRCVWKSSSPFT